jgi:hypothetical protein
MSEEHWVGKAARVGPNRWTIFEEEEYSGRRQRIQTVETVQDIYVPQPEGDGWEVTTEMRFSEQPDPSGSYVRPGAQHYWYHGRELSQAQWELMWSSSAP